MTLEKALARADKLAPGDHPSGKTVRFAAGVKGHRCHPRIVDEQLDSADALGVLAAEVRRLQADRDTPHIADFLEAVRLEALHQRTRWGTEHDSGKTPADWFWLLGYLAGKALRAATNADISKAQHHTISSAAALLNWHAALSGESNAMRPGIEEPSL